MSEQYYIDGYNILHASPELRSLADQDLESAREALIEQIATFCATTGKRATLVFDGLGRHQPGQTGENRGVAGLQVIYAPTNLSADSIIERRIYREKSRMETIAVTNDQGIRDLCRGMGSLVMSAGNFIATLSETLQDTRRTIQQPAKELDGARVEERLGADTFDQLQALKERLSNDGK